jgi:hypothetical protein
MNPPTPGPATLWRRWVVLVTAGELTGFAAPALAGASSLGLASGTQLLLMTIAGAVEGAVLGAAQAHVLRSVLPGFRVRAWVLATAGAAALAWVLGMLPSSTHGWWSTWPTPVVIVLAVPTGAALLLSIGTAQALVLPDGTAGSRRWIGWTALGWCAGLLVFVGVATPLWHEGQPRWEVLGIGLVAGAAMAATMAAITGLGMLRLRAPVSPCPEAVPGRRTGRP